MISYSFQPKRPRKSLVSLAFSHVRCSHNIDMYVPVDFPSRFLSVSAAIWHHDSHSVRRWTHLSWTFGSSTWTSSSHPFLGQPWRCTTRSAAGFEHSFGPTSTIITIGGRTGQQSSTWSSFPTCGSADYWAFGTIPYGTGHEIARNWTGLSANSHSTHSIWCVWPPAWTSRLLSCTNLEEICIPKKSQCTTNHSSQETTSSLGSFGNSELPDIATRRTLTSFTLDPFFIYQKRLRRACRMAGAKPRTPWSSCFGCFVCLLVGLILTKWCLSSWG